MIVLRIAGFLRRRWRYLVFAAALACILAASTAALLPRRYVADAELFVGLGGLPRSNADLYQGGQFIQDRVKSYAAVPQSAAVTSAVVSRLNLPMKPTQVQEEIHATVPVGTVLLDVSVSDSDARRAAAIA